MLMDHNHGMIEFIYNGNNNSGYAVSPSNGGGGASGSGLHDRVKIIRGAGASSSTANNTNGAGSRYGSVAPSGAGAGRSPEPESLRRGGATNGAGVDPAAIAGAKRKREIQDRISKYGRDLYERRDECVFRCHCPSSHVVADLIADLRVGRTL
jgi:hypothetical protein